MKKQFIIISILVFGAYSILNGIGVISLTFDSISILFKLTWAFVTIYSIFYLVKKAIIKTALIFAFLSLSIVITKTHNQFSFFPTFGGYELTSTYYNNNEQSFDKQDRIEFFTKEYALNNTAKKYERVKVYFGFLEIRNEETISFEELETYKYEKWF